jgi:hypothetical protein
VAADAAGFPRGTPIYVGTYGVNVPTARQVRELAGGRYAPMISMRPGWFWERRRLSPEEEALLGPGARRYRGAIPSLARQRALPTAERVRWGVELGARFRDAVRAGEREGAAVDAWQLDEIGPSAARAAGRPIRELTRGVVRGLLLGRPPLGDLERRGFVWWANSAVPLALRHVDAELTAFWRTLNRATLGLVGEEYPPFEGDAGRAASSYGRGRRYLAAGGPVRRALARKYVAGMTPGYHLARSLGGNVHGWPRAQVNRWRAAYVAARRSEYEQDVDLLRLAADLVIDAVIEPEELRGELVRRFAVLAGKVRPAVAKRHGVPPV